MGDRLYVMYLFLLYKCKGIKLGLDNVHSVDEIWSQVHEFDSWIPNLIEVLVFVQNG